MVPDMVSRPSMSVVQSASPEEVAAAERWHQWQLRYAAVSRTGARRARIAFAVIFAGPGAWLGLQLLNPSFWP
jgi:hypothetical protein